MKTHRTSEIKRAVQAIGSLPTPDDKEVSTLEAVRMLAPAIDRARKQGHTIETIVESLAQSGVEISCATLKRYLLTMKADGAVGRAAAAKPRSKRGKRVGAAAAPPDTAMKSSDETRKPPDVPRGSFVVREDTKDI